MKVAEAAKILGVSKKTIYRKIDKLDLTSKGHVKQVGHTKTLTTEGFEFIRLSFDKGRVKDNLHDNVKEKGPGEGVVGSYKQLLEEQKELYEKLLLEKDKLIVDLREDKDRLMKMQENNQVLIAREQERVLLLEESVEKRSFWNRFKREKAENDR